MGVEEVGAFDARPGGRSWVTVQRRTCAALSTTSRSQGFPVLTRRRTAIGWALLLACGCGGRSASVGFVAVDGGQEAHPAQHRSRTDRHCVRRPTGRRRGALRILLVGHVESALGQPARDHRSRWGDGPCRRRWRIAGNRWPERHGRRPPVPVHGRRHRAGRPEHRGDLENDSRAHDADHAHAVDSSAFADRVLWRRLLPVHGVSAALGRRGRLLPKRHRAFSSERRDAGAGRGRRRTCHRRWCIDVRTAPVSDRARPRSRRSYAESRGPAAPGRARRRWGTGPTRCRPNPPSRTTRTSSELALGRLPPPAILP